MWQHRAVGALRATDPAQRGRQLFSRALARSSLKLPAGPHAGALLKHGSSAFANVLGGNELDWCGGMGA